MAERGQVIEGLEQASALNLTASPWSCKLRIRFDLPVTCRLSRGYARYWQPTCREPGGYSCTLTPVLYPDMP